MAKSPAFQFYARDWLGDPEIMLMDWDARGMHLHFMCIAWLQDNPCTLLDDDKMLMKLVGVTDEQDWFDRLKGQIFSAWDNEDGRWVQARLLREKNKQLDHSSKRKKAAEKRWNNEASKCNANAMHVECLSSSTSSSTSLVEEVSSNEDTCEILPAKSEKNYVPFVEIVNLYHEVLPELPRVEKLTNARKGYIRQRWKNDLKKLDNWKNYFSFVRRSDFLMGRVESNNGRKPFIANLEWLTKEGNFVKVSEDKYHGQI